jgi:hypothetical protein
MADRVALLEPGHRLSGSGLTTATTPVQPGLVPLVPRVAHQVDDDA